MYTLEHYVLYSNVSDFHFVHDFGSEDGLGLQYDHVHMKLDRKVYRYNTYHYAFASLGASVLNGLNIGAREHSPGVVNPNGLFIRTLPLGTNLYADAEAEVDIEQFPALPVYDWEF